MENEELMNNNITGIEAAYALNMCTVSISQIIDYNDVYVLEQEYDAILNNLNLEKIRKHDALLNTFVEMLNTISFFRIQEIKKEMIERQYQQRMKSALWSAIPNLGVIVAGGHPAVIAYSLVSQIGTGYMNYRKERATAMSEKEKAEMELSITAMEQFHALRRELFVTSWKLAEAYKIKDEWRLTEKQIKQYNEILMDPDEIRKYERLESIQSKFEAYPPFWYHIGHTADYIAGSLDIQLSEEVKAEYRELAKKHFEKFEQCNKYNILREDQLTASFALEYVDLLLLEDKPDFAKIEELLRTAVNMSGNANDVLELCAIAYLKIGNGNEASRLLKVLVNEGYNLEVNAKLLSRLYVSSYIFNGDEVYRRKYEVLSKRVNPALLFPMPIGKIEDKTLQEQFMCEQREVLIEYVKNVLDAFARKYMSMFNRVLFIPNSRKSYDEFYFGDDNEERCQDIKNVLSGNDRKDYIKQLSEKKFRSVYLEILNDMLNELDGLLLYYQCKKKDGLIILIKQELLEHKTLMNEIQVKLENGEFGTEEYEEMRKELSFSAVTNKFFESLKKNIVSQIQGMQSLEELSKAEDDLQDFYRREELSLYDECNPNKFVLTGQKHRNQYLKDNLLGSAMKTETQLVKKVEKMCEAIQRESQNILREEPENITIIMKGTEEFRDYFNNSKLKSIDTSNVLAIISDRTNIDLVFNCDGLTIVEKNRLKSQKPILFEKVEKNDDKLILGKIKYSNPNIYIDKLYRLIQDLGEMKTEEG